MAVLKRHRVPGLTKEKYDEVSSATKASQESAPGFIAHYAVFDDDVLTVIEIWDSQDDHDRWFDANIKPNLPEGAVPPAKFVNVRKSIIAKNSEVATQS
jgi:hypothetical protein